MVDPMPTFDGSEAANLKALLNAISSAVEGYVGQSIDEVLARFFAATVDDLPETGNQQGQLTYVADVQRVYVCTELPGTWVRLDQLGWAEVEPTLGAGWTNVDHKKLMRRGGFAYLQFNATRVSNLAIDGVLCEIPAGYRTDLKNWWSAWHVDVAGEFFQVYYEPTLHKILTREVIPADAGVALSMMWPLT